MQPELFTGNFLGSFEQSFTLIIFTLIVSPIRRITTLDLQARKMKFLFKKWLVRIGELFILLKCCTLIQDFETAHGTEGGVSEVKNSAQRYLESRGGPTEPEPS